MYAAFPYCLTSKSREARQTSKNIDKILYDGTKSHKAAVTQSWRTFYGKRQLQLLVLGCMGSGKTTFLQQMRVISGDGFDNDALHEYKCLIYVCLVRGMKELANVCSNLNIPFSDSKSEINVQIVRDIHEDEIRTLVDECSDSNFLRYGDAIEVLWNDSAIRTALEHLAKLSIQPDTLKYFCNNIGRIKQKEYVPTTSDVLHVWQPTCHITEYSTLVNERQLRFIDLGGQSRSASTKWYHYFDRADAILFVASLSDYDKEIAGDRGTNLLRESLQRFDTIINNRFLLNVKIFLILNKSDLLEEKVSKISIADYFDGFDGDPQSASEVKEFILGMFSERVEKSERTCHYRHFTTATDTANVTFVFQAIQDTILLSSRMLHFI